MSWVTNIPASEESFLFVLLSETRFAYVAQFHFELMIFLHLQECMYLHNLLKFTIIINIQFSGVKYFILLYSQCPECFSFPSSSALILLFVSELLNMQCLHRADHSRYIIWVGWHNIFLVTPPLTISSRFNCALCVICQNFFSFILSQLCPLELIFETDYHAAQNGLEVAI